MRRALGLAVAAAAIAAGSGAPRRVQAEESVLRQGDRVVLYGDSITEQRLYTRFVRLAFHLLAPDADVRFWNAGWGGDTAAGARRRLERDVLSRRPTVVTLLFGMNDGGYRQADDAVVGRYRDEMEGLVDAIRAAGARVVVFAPGAVDPDRNAPLGACRYDETLAALGRAAKAVARARKLPFGDVREAMLAYQEARKRETPSWTMIPDGVHPNAEGQVVMAAAVLRTLGLPPAAPMGRVDLATGKGDGLEVASKDDGVVTLRTTKPLPCPYWVDPAVLRAARDGGLLALVGQRLAVTGLPAGEWEVSVDGAEAGRWSADALAAGVLVPGTWSAQAKRLHDLVERQENHWFAAWRETLVPLEGDAAAGPLREGFEAANEGFHAAVRAIATRAESATVVLAPAVAGENLALRKPYESSDANRHGWGSGGLTDGSWEGDARHCFATGENAKFPKWVTVDLGAPARLAAVRLGVPAFGSTRTVEVSLSADGKRFREVGRTVFGQEKAERRLVRFAPATARWVRLTYADHHSKRVQFPPEFAFTTELEAYAEPGR